MAVTDAGYIRPSYDELLERRIALAKELFGDDIDTRNDSPLGKFIRLAVKDLADAYEGQEIIYYSRFPTTATGQSLDRLMPFACISRNVATRAKHEVKFKGTANHVIEMGFLVGTINEEEFFLNNNLTLGENGEGVGEVECTVAGTIGNVTLGAITEIINPDANVLEIAHLNITELGKEEESDPELRERFSLALSGSGSGTADAIKGAIMRINGVRSCVVIENDTDSTSKSGIPPHSFETFVYAPESLDQKIGEAIFSKKSCGIKAHGDTTVTVVDVSGNNQTVAFSRVAEMPVHMRISIKTDTHFELNGVEQIKTALMKHVDKLSVGEDVIFSSLFSHIFKVAGVVDVTDLTLSSDGSVFKSANVAVDEGSVATLSAEHIEVTLNEDN